MCRIAIDFTDFGEYLLSFSWYLRLSHLCFDSQKSRAVSGQLSGSQTRYLELSKLLHKQVYASMLLSRNNDKKIEVRLWCNKLLARFACDCFAPFIDRAIHSDWQHLSERWLSTFHLSTILLRVLRFSAQRRSTPLVRYWVQSAMSSRGTLQSKCMDVEGAPRRGNHALKTSGFHVCKRKKILYSNEKRFTAQDIDTTINRRSFSRTLLNTALHSTMFANLTTISASISTMITQI